DGARPRPNRASRSPHPAPEGGRVAAKRRQGPKTKGWPMATPSLAGPEAWRSGILRRLHDGLGAAAAATAVGGRRHGLLHRLGRARRLAAHDVVDLVRVEGLPLEQRLGHHLDLVAVLLEQAA